MSQEQANRLLWLYNTFDKARQQAVQTQFEALSRAFPDKCHHQGGFTDLWLTAIADVRDGVSPWVRLNISFPTRQFPHPFSSVPEGDEPPPKDAAMAQLSAVLLDVAKQVRRMERTPIDITVTVEKEY